MPSNESTLKLKADVTSLKAAMQEAGRQIRLANSEFNAAAAGMDDWSKSADGLTAKITQLDKVLGAQKSQLSALESEYEKIAAEQGEGSKGAQELMVRINNQKAAIAKTEKSLNEYTNALDEVENAADDMGDAIEESTDDLKKSGDGFSVLKGVMSNLVSGGISLVTNGLKDLASEAIKAGTDFEEAMSKVEAISGASATDMDRLTEKAKEMGASTKFSATESAEALNYMAMAGWSTEDMLNGIDGVMNLAAASGEDLATTSDIVTDALTAMGYSAGDATHFADVMAAASSNANTNVSMMGSTFQYAAPIVGALGYNMEDTAVAIGLMANAGIKGEKAGTALRAILTRLSAPPKECAAAMEELGISMTDNEGNMKSLDEVMGELRTAFDGLSETEQTAAAKHIAGANAMSGLLAIVNAAPEDYDALTQAINNSSGAAKEMADIMQDNLGGDLTKMDSALEGLGIAAFEYVDGPLRGVVQGVTEIISGITEAITPQKTALDNFVDEISASNDEVQRSLDEAHSVMDSYEADAEKLQKYSDVLQNVAEKTELTELEKYEVSQIVGELADSVPELSAAWDAEAGALNLTAQEVDNLMQSYQDSLKQQAYAKAMQESFDALMQSEINAAKAAPAVVRAQEELTAAQDNYNASRDKYNQLRAQSGLKPGEMVDAEADALERAQDALDNANAAQEEANRLQEEAQSEYDTTREALEAMGATFDETGNIILDSGKKTEEGADQTNEAIASLDPDQLEEVADAAEDMRESIEQSMQGAVNAFEEFSGGTEISLDDALKNLESQKTGLEEWSENMEALAEKIGEGGETISQEFYDYLAEMGPEGANLVQELVDSMEAEDGKFSEVSKAWMDAMELSADSGKIADATSAGKDYADAFGEGLAKQKSAVGDEADGLVEEANDRLEKGKDEAEDKGEGFGDGFADGVKAKSDAVKQVAVDVVEGTVTAAGNVDTTSTGRYIDEGIIEGMEAKRSAVMQKAREIAEAAAKTINDALKIKSPSKVTYQTGVWFTQGFINGISSQQAGLVRTIQSLVGAAVRELTRADGFDYAGAGTRASSVFSAGVSKQLDYLINRITYENESKLEEFDKDIADLEAKQNAETQALTNASEARIAAIEETMTSERERFDAAQKELAASNKTALNDLKEEYEDIVEDLKYNYDVMEFDLQMASEKTQKSIQKKIDKLGNSDADKKKKKKLQSQLDAEKKSLSEILDAAKKSLNAELEEQKKQYNARVEAQKENNEKLEDELAAERKAREKELNESIKLDQEATKADIAAIEESYKKLIDAQAEAKASYQEASSAMLSEFRQAMSDYQKAAQDLIDDTINGITERYSTRYDILVGKQNNLIDKLKDAASLFEVSGAGVMTIGDLEEQTKQITDYTSKLQAIKEKVSAELFDEIAEFDIKEGSAYIDRLLEMSAEELTAYNDAYTKKLEAAQKASEAIYKNDFTDVRNDYENELESAFDTLPAQLEDLGMQAMQGFLSGLTENTDYMKEQVQTFIAGMIDEFKKDLKIASPSKVMFGLGEFTGEGFGDGLLNMIRYVRNAATSLADIVATPLDDVVGNIGDIRQAMPQGAGAVGGSGNVTNNYNLVQNNTSPKALSALETYQARRQQIALVKAFA